MRKKLLTQLTSPRGGRKGVALILLALTMTAMGGAAWAGQRATVRIDDTQRHQYITGFGGFVCSPQFQYNHMSTTDIKKVWGQGSTVGCNIMRLYIPIGKNSWSQSLQTAKNAKQMGLIVFASPWGQPAEWKTNGTSNAKNSDGTLGYLKRENWGDYAQYLEDYVQYMRQNGVELDAISIQNEPDWPAEYAGCLWSAQDMAEFVKTYGPTISCRIMTPETLAVSDSYVNALNKSDVLDCFDIYGGHQYGGIQSGYKQLAQKGKEVWMTEYLINWNEAENNTRNFDFSKDFFNFFRAINTCMLGDFNAWIHYAAKRYYGMLGDGQRGTTTGTVTKRGYVMAHFARYITGMTRIDANFNDEAATPLEGSAYISQTTDSVAIVIANPADEERTLTVDLPFYTMQGTVCSTTKTKNFSQTTVTLSQEECRPQVSIPALSVATVLFVRSSDRQHSDMKGATTRFDRLDEQKTTSTSFGTTYKMSGKTKKFDHNNPLISTRTTATAGYIALDDRYNQLVMQVKKLTSTMNYSSAITTLYYINNQGQVSTHNYGDLEFGSHENFNWVFDLSPATLTDGCRGILSMTNNNWSSTLTFTFGDVYLTRANSQYSATLSGTYVADDSYVLDFTTDPACTSIDMTACTQLPATLPWLEGTNRVAFLAEGTETTTPNTVVGNTCAQLTLTADGGPFRPAKAFNAAQASFTTAVNGCRMLMIPFEATVPEGVQAYTLNNQLEVQQVQTITAHQPVIIVADGEVTLNGTGEVSFAISNTNDVVRGTYVPAPLYLGDYILQQQDNRWGLARMTQGTLEPFDVYVLPLTESATFIPLKLPTQGIAELTTWATDTGGQTYNIMGQKVNPQQRGIIIRNGKKYMKR